MKNKGLLLGVAALVLAFGQASFGQSTTAAPASTDGLTIHQRQERQQDRIQNGFKDGQLNQKQAAHLEHEQRHINREADKMRAANGGTLSAKQRAMLNHQQNKTSRQINRARR